MVLEFVIIYRFGPQCPYKQKASRDGVYAYIVVSHNCDMFDRRSHRIASNSHFCSVRSACVKHIDKNSGRAGDGSPAGVPPRRHGPGEWLVCPRPGGSGNGTPSLRFCWFWLFLFVPLWIPAGFRNPPALFYSLCFSGCGCLGSGPVVMLSTCFCSAMADLAAKICGFLLRAGSWQTICQELRDEPWMSERLAKQSKSDQKL
jgi:hypothetical protein